MPILSPEAIARAEEVLRPCSDGCKTLRTSKGAICDCGRDANLLAVAAALDAEDEENQNKLDATWNAAMEKCAVWHDEQVNHFVDALDVLSPSKNALASIAEVMVRAHLEHTIYIRALKRPEAAEEKSR